MKLTKILFAAFGGAALTLGFSGCGQNAEVNTATANTAAANQTNAAAVVNSNSAKPANTAAVRCRFRPESICGVSVRRDGERRFDRCRFYGAVMDRTPIRDRHA